MIAANYVSMLVGIVGVSALSHMYFARAPEHLYQAPWVLLCAVLASYVATLIVEWPYVWAAFSKAERRFSRSLLGCLAAQSASYCLLAVLYGITGGTGLLTHTTFDRSLSFLDNEQAVVYFLSSDSREVRRIRLDGSAAQRVSAVTAKETIGHLFVRRCHHSERWDLYGLGWPVSRDSPEMLLAEGINPAGTTLVHDTPDPVGDRKARPLRPRDIRADRDEALPFWHWHWAGAGIAVGSFDSDDRVHLRLETPFLWLGFEHATVIPGDQVVFELDQHSICVYDAKSRKLGLLTEGRAPIVVLEVPLEGTEDK